MTRPGTTLANGAIVIEQRGEFVFCVIPHNAVTPYATWHITADGDTFHGEYFRDLDEALAGFAHRAGSREVAA